MASWRAWQGSLSGFRGAWRGFFASTLLRQAGLVFGLGAALLMVVTDHDERRRQYASAEAQLLAQVDRLTDQVQEVRDLRRKSLLFLASMPEVHDLAQVLGPDGQPGASALKRARLEQVFKSLLVSAPEMYRVRIIELTGGARELLRVERRGGEVIGALPGAQLAPAEARAYDELARSGPGAVLS